jgi:hypothetical protein
MGTCSIENGACGGSEGVRRARRLRDVQRSMRSAGWRPCMTLSRMVARASSSWPSGSGGAGLEAQARRRRGAQGGRGTRRAALAQLASVLSMCGGEKEPRDRVTGG